ncbi:hypothetical protein GCG54_00009253 [Colletotrichum gloeosporioides]|uniref:Uncharacterized protein n=1 Tax=Colletotrichum gloeosporioides TaxID=474922 RepID=A0A8H4FBT7_COLGL|nr:uncharacterized protein GCG54_00009253 [Colletotrichum gloeosporioides]KAF3797282.1 hypothetical protein GCG54_00009253 [Colletotrichum gloeosporioides]
MNRLSKTLLHLQAHDAENEKVNLNLTHAPIYLSLLFHLRANGSSRTEIEGSLSAVRRHPANLQFLQTLRDTIHIPDPGRRFSKGGPEAEAHRGDRGSQEPASLDILQKLRESENIDAAIEDIEYASLLLSIVDEG